ncbi:MAG: hypothetical protein K8R68_09450, partial [Bacteroidales bacterium]|nr:hypothetical protein [Bacteroidales bacterium]
MIRTKFIFAFFILYSVLLAEDNQQALLKKTTIESAKYFDVNRISCAVQNNGVFARQPVTGNSDFSLDGNYVIYTSGLWIAAKVNGEVRASAADFNTDFIGGAIDDLGNPFGKEDSTFRVYKISRGDNAANNPDYAEWPIELGAPSDEQGNPLLIGDQTLWCSFTDAFVEDRIWYNICPPLNAEIHLTVWGWEHIDNVMFLRWEIINKSNETWDDAYFGIYSDPDVMNANDDLTGSDSTLNLAYCYDGKDQWGILPYHAVGYQMLGSPIVASDGDTAVTFWGVKPGYQNIPVYAPRMEKNLGRSNQGWNDISYQTDHTAQQVYNRLNCLDYDGNPAIDPITNQPSKWVFSGDPVAGTGWLEDIMPRDRRIMVSTGPISIAPGDTSAITLAIIPVCRDYRLNCVFDLKQQAQGMRSVFLKKCGIYSEFVAAHTGQTEVAFPINLINFIKIRHVEFSLDIKSEDIQFIDIVPAERIQDFSIQYSIDQSTNLLTVVIDANNKLLNIGSGGISNLIFDVDSVVDSFAAPIKIANIKCISENNTYYEIDPVDGLIKIEELPDPARLLTPYEDQYIDGMSVHFSWNKTAGSDSNIYRLKFLNDEIYSHIVIDTFICLPIKDFVFANTESVDWTVEIINYLQPIFSPDTFKVNLPTPEELTFAKELYFFETPGDSNVYEEIGNYVINKNYLYVFSYVGYEYENSSKNYNRVLVYQLNEHGVELVNNQTMNYFRGPHKIDGPIEIVGNKAFIFTYGGYLETYIIDEDKEFVFQQRHCIAMPNLCRIIGDYLFVVSLYISPKISVFKINSLLDIVKVSEFDLIGWEINGFKYDRMDIENNFLFLALSDWGIFDVSNPDSINLVARVKIPGNAIKIKCDDNRIYVSSDENWIGIYDVTDKQNPSLIYSEKLCKSQQYMNEMDEFCVFDGYIGFSFLYGDEFQLCHYEPGKHLILDGIFKGTNIKFYDDKIYSNYSGKFLVYENKLVTGIMEHEPG